VCGVVTKEKRKKKKSAYKGIINETYLFFFDKVPENGWVH
jgi:hypothetical protein